MQLLRSAYALILKKSDSNRLGAFMTLLKTMTVPFNKYTEISQGLCPLRA